MEGMSVSGMVIHNGMTKKNINELNKCQAKLQHNLTFLAKLADAGSQTPTPTPLPAPTPSQVSQQAIMQQGQGMQQPQVANQPQPDLSALNLPLEMNDQQQLQQHQHLAMSLQMNEQNYQLPHFLYQQQIIPGSMGGFPVANSGLYQASQTRLSNLSETPSSYQTGSDSGPGWS
ncbi:hypothetical protein glysoja_015620 [Glycine soja]|nr:hypothetical protein glysoja_015620 [Glycine soja]